LYPAPRSKIWVFLYAILLIQILISFSNGNSRLSLILLIIGIASLSSRLILPQATDEQQEMWLDVRQKLQVVLIESKIISGSHLSKSSLQLEPALLDEPETQLSAIQVNPLVIKELRTLGIDGILICLYLMKYRDSYCSIKMIQKHLNIPMTTVYRNITKLVNSEKN